MGGAPSEVAPALRAPPGITSNLVNPSSESYISIMVTVILIVITTPFVLLRLYSRYFINRRLWWDDYTSVIAWVGLCSFAGIMLGTIQYGNGRNMWDVSQANAARFMKLSRSGEILARISIFFTKFSILLLFLRLFEPPSARRDSTFYVIWAIIWANLLYCIALVLVVLLNCVGRPKAVGFTLEHNCIKGYPLMMSASVINVISDVVLLIIPLVKVWRLQMKLRRKLGLLTIFFVGFLALIISIVRFGWQVRIARNPNRTVILPRGSLFAMSEQAVGVIVGCMPVLPALYHIVYGHRPESGYPKSISYHRQSGYERKSSLPGRYSLSTREAIILSARGNPDREGVDFQGNVLKIERDCSSISAPAAIVEGWHRNPDTDVVVSKSVDVEVANGSTPPVCDRT